MFPHVLQSLLSVDRNKLDEAKKEANTLHQLRHPHIVGYITSYDYSISWGRKGFAIVTRFCEKGSLEQYLKNNEDTRVMEAKRLKWFKQLAEALQYIHSKNITHRDLKPGNILIDGDDDLKIADVGLAKAVWDIQEVYLRQNAGVDSLEKYMTTEAGTVPYMAPEVFNKHYDSKSDIFSLGLVFVMIAECPVTPYLTARWQSYEDFVGKLLDMESMLRSLPASHYLVPQLKYSKPSEIRMFNNMLKFDHHERLSANEVIEELDQIERASDIIVRSTNPSINLDPEPESVSWCC